MTAFTIACFLCCILRSLSVEQNLLDFWERPLSITILNALEESFHPAIPSGKTLRQKHRGQSTYVPRMALTHHSGPEPRGKKAEPLKFFPLVTLFYLESVMQPGCRGQ